MKPQDSQIQRCMVSVALISANTIEAARGKVRPVQGDGRQRQPGPGEQYNPGWAGSPTPARQAATVILLRDADERLEVLLVQRSPQARFMGGVWVFPGGSLEPGEGDGLQAHRAAAIRELREEAGVVLHERAELIEFSRWITPAEVRTRFDTRFFLAQMPAGQQVTLDGRECVDHRWLAPSAALAAHEQGELMLVFPTIKHLERLSDFVTAAELIADARGRKVGPVQPRVIVEGETARVVLPGEPGY